MASNVNANSGLIYKHCDKCGEPLYYGTSHICESSIDMVRKAIAARDKEWVEWIEKTFEITKVCTDCVIGTKSCISRWCTYRNWQERKKEISQ